MKKYKVHIQKKAIDELDQTYSFICKDSPRTARKLIGELKNKIRSLSTMPFRGSLVRGLNLESPVRFISHKEHLLFYTIESDKVLLLHIMGRGQDWWNLLELP